MLNPLDSIAKLFYHQPSLLSPFRKKIDTNKNWLVVPIAL
jgi:hypothetical protein